MNKVLKKAVFHISVCKNDGLSESKLLKLLHEEFDGVFSFRDEDVLALIRKTPEILLKNGDQLLKTEQSNANLSGNKKSERIFVAEKDIQNHVLKNNLLNRHFHNDDNQEDSEAIFQMYQEIVKAGAAGISYEELSDIFAKKGIKGLSKQKLESYMVSNYCCKLAKHNFINITFQNLRRMVIDVRFNKVALENFLNPNKKNPEGGNTSVANINSEEAGDQQKKQQRQEHQKEINSVTQENIIEYLNKETFTIRELSQRQNIVLNLQSHFAQKNDGLTTKEICLRIRMLHEKKALDRIIKSIEKAYKVETIAARMGKSYSHKFVIRHPGVKNYKPPIEFSSDVKLEDPETYGLVKAENEDAESSSDVMNASSTAKKSHLPPVLHYEVFKDILEILTENKQFREFVESKGEDLAKLKEAKQSDEDYAKTAERILMILVDNESKLFNENTEEPETKGGFSKKSLTRLKLNRYIFILNKVREHEVTTNILLKTMIINEIEVGTGWKIDRKTLKQLLTLLQKLGLIKLLDYKFNYPFNNNYKGSNEAKEDVQYTRIVVLARKISANDPRIQTILSKSNMASLKKEAEAARLPMNRKRGLLDKEAIFLEDQDTELGGATLKKVKPLKDQMETMKKKKEEFEQMTGDAATKLKKFDFASCKLLAKEYKIMMFASYFENLFIKKINAMKQITLKNLKKYETIRIYEYIDATDKTLSSSISGIVGRKRHPMGLGSKNLDIIKAFTTSTASQNSILSYDVKNRTLCEDIGKRFEKDFYNKMEAEHEVDQIIQQSQAQGVSAPNKRLESLFNFPKNNQVVSSHRSFLEQVEKRFHNNSVLLNDEDRQKRQRDQARLANLITTCPVKNVDQVLAKHAKIPERKEVMEHMGISEELVFKEVEPLFNVSSMVVEPESYKFITRPVPMEELDKALDRKNIYYSAS